VGRPFITDEPPMVIVFAPSMTPQPLLGTGAPLPPPPPLPPLPELPPFDEPPLPALPPIVIPPEAWPPVAVPPVAAPPLGVPPFAMPPLAVPPLAVPPLVLPPVAEPAVGEPPVELPPVLPPVLLPADPPPPSGFELAQLMIPNDIPNISVGSHFVCMRSSRGTERPGTFLSRRRRVRSSKCFDG
jgi:hypothetical protein